MVINIITIDTNEYKSAVNLSKFIITYGIHTSPFGNCLIGIINNQNAICHLWFFDDDSLDDCLKIMENQWRDIELIEDITVTNKIFKAIFTDTADDLFVFLKGTHFQIRVWEALMNIPKGKTVTYSDIAKIIGNPKAIRAVGTAIANNKIAFLVPCHRVLPKNNTSTKFRWGTERRFAILKYEKTNS